jgi:4-hydroxybenzoate polyprenyltransferase
MFDVFTFLRISRPRFWLYLIGPILVASGVLKLDFSLTLLIWILVFLFPANFFIYAVNDVFDRETDALNSKKDEYELRLPKNIDKKVWFLVLGLCVPLVLLLMMFANLKSNLYLVLFLFFGFFYSSPPIRAKVIPFIDGLFNILYVLPGFAFYALYSDNFVSVSVVVASVCWCAAMHAYSAIPDILSDKLSGINTTATLLGEGFSLLYVFILFSVSGFLLLGELTFAFICFSLACYWLFVLLSWKFKNVFYVYKFFPYLNTLIGFLLFLP